METVMPFTPPPVSAILSRREVWRSCNYRLAGTAPPLSGTTGAVTYDSGTVAAPGHDGGGVCARA
jgi:hypothetical protein